MTIGTRQRLDGTDHLGIKTDNINIRSVSNQKLMGLHIGENLNWNNHIDNLCKVISSKIPLLRQLAEYVPLQVQKQFYQGYILLLLDFGSITKGSTTNANIEKLSKLQKRPARIILKADLDRSSVLMFQELDPSVLMFQELDWLSVRSRLKYNKAVVIYVIKQYDARLHNTIAYTDVPDALIKSKIRTKWYFIYTFSTYFAV